MNLQFTVYPLHSLGQCLQISNTNEPIAAYVVPCSRIFIL